MNEQEISRLGAEFKAETTRLFAFLVDELDFDPPTDASTPHRHALAYEHRARGLTVLLANAFHPYDYGFEITLYPAGAPWHGDDRNMIFAVLKEDQDPDFRFLHAAPATVRRALADVVHD